MRDISNGIRENNKVKEEQNRIGNTEEIEVEREKIKNEEREIEMKSNLRQGKKTQKKWQKRKKT